MLVLRSTTHPLIGQSVRPGAKLQSFPAQPPLRKAQQLHISTCVARLIYKLPKLVFKRLPACLSGLARAHQGHVLTRKNAWANNRDTWQPASRAATILDGISGGPHDQRPGRQPTENKLAQRGNNELKFLQHRCATNKACRAGDEERMTTLRTHYDNDDADTSNIRFA